MIGEPMRVSTYTPNPIDGWAVDAPRAEPVRDARITAAALELLPEPTPMTSDLMEAA